MYQDLLAVTINHSYFVPESAFDCGLEPTQNTKRLLLNLDVVALPFKNGITIKFSPGTDGREAWFNAIADTCLVFYIKPNDEALFQSVTQQTPLTEPAVEVYWLDEHSAQLPVASYTQKQLSLIQSLIDIPKIPAREEEAKNNKGQKTITAPKQDDELKQLISKLNVRRERLVVIPLKHINKKSTTNIDIQFQTIALPFKYYFLSAATDAAYNVVDQTRDNASVQYERSIETLSNGQQVLAFTSIKPIELKQKSQKSFSLLKLDASGETTIIDVLPLPKIENRFKHYPANGNSTYVLEAFIH